MISAEIPDPQTEPRLHAIVARCMMHGPCGTANPNAPCMENGKCSKGYPKEWNDVTIKNTKGYPTYRRRRNTTFITVRGHNLDNRHVVPHNKYLSLKYDAHINVEACTSLIAVKYIYKYIYKGFDCAEIIVGQGDNQRLIIDEIANYVSARYISAPEAIWRLFKFIMHDRSHVIIHLPVHLRDNQTITFREGREVEALEQARSRETELTAWFKLNQNDVSARNYLYAEIPYYYTYDKGEWKERERNLKLIPRMYTVGIKDEERFYLRILLLHVRGATSYEDLRTVDGVLYDTYRSAAFHRHLLSTDKEWENCLREAAIFQMPKQMRQTFAYILIYGDITPPEDSDITGGVKLWEMFKADMALDFLRNYDQDTALNYALHDIQSVLEQHGDSCTKFGLPEPTGVVVDVPQYNIALQRSEAERLIQTLNAEQRSAFDNIVGGADNTSAQKLFYLNGPGGSGKTYLYSTLITYIEGRGEYFCAYASTGIASTLFKNGRTAHSGFGLPVPLLETSTSRIRMGTPQTFTLRDAKIIIIDEVTMLTKDALRCINLLLQGIMKNELAFGGKTLVLSGDFRQTLPVVPRGTKNDILEACLKSSPLWPLFRELSLISNMRSSGRAAHNSWLLDIGSGSLPNIDGLNEGVIEVPRTMITLNNLIGDIFGDNVENLSHNELSRRVILASTNRETLDINNQIIEKLSGDMKIYKSADSLATANDNTSTLYPVEYLNTLQPSGVPPHELRLKVGTVVMLIRNLNAKKGLCNGTRLIIRRLHENFLTCEIISECNNGDMVFIPRIDIAPSDPSLPFELKRRPAE